jgi:hypothetical protein
MWWGLPYVIRTVGASLVGLDRTLEEAASSLGASPLVAFRTVTLPLLKPGILAGAIFVFVTSLDELVASLFPTGRGSRAAGPDLHLHRVHLRPYHRRHLGRVDRLHHRRRTGHRADRRLRPVLLTRSARSTALLR